MRADEVAVTAYEVDALAVGDGNELGFAILELHDRGLVVFKLGLVGEGLSRDVFVESIGIESLGEVDPVLLHEVGDAFLLRILLGFFVEAATEIHAVVGMSCTSTIAVGIDGTLGLLGEVSHIDGTLASLLLERGPSIGGPTKIEIANEIAEGKEALFVVGGRVVGLDGIGKGRGQRKPYDLQI